MVELEVVNWEVEEGSQAAWLGFSNGEKKGSGVDTYQVAIKGVVNLVHQTS
jgi:hypothetical protein